MPANKEANHQVPQRLTAEQDRLVKSVKAMLVHAIKTDSETDFFETSSELFRLVATAIKRSDFVNENKSAIAYDKQVLEFCIDILADQVSDNDVVKYDN